MFSIHPIAREGSVGIIPKHMKTHETVLKGTVENSPKMSKMASALSICAGSLHTSMRPVPSKFRRNSTPKGELMEKLAYKVLNG